jgi:branched-chain amino acid transport system ATP-binding protein
MIDEPTEGLTPMIVQQVGDLIDEIAQRGVPNLLVEQNLSIAMRISYRTYVMGNGRIVFEGGTQFTENRNTAKLSISFRVD